MKCCHLNCSWDGPEHLGERVDGIFYCLPHRSEVLHQTIGDGLPTLQIGDNGRPSDSRWLNRFARLVSDRESARANALTKGKLERRSRDFVVRGTAIFFSIERHPVYATIEQTRKYEVTGEELVLIRERVLNSPFSYDPDEDSYICPECGESLSCSPGIARCSYCLFEARHEHTRAW